jgi:hypothetical protein
MKAFAIACCSLLLISGCALQDKPAAEPDSGQDVASGPDVASADDVHADGPALPPMAWSTRETRTPIRLHATWQHDPATSITLQWQTVDTDIDSYVPRVWFGLDTEVTSTGDDQWLPLGEGHVVEGVGESYSTIFEKGKVFVTWTVELTGLSPQTAYAYRVGSWESIDEATGRPVGADLSPLYHFHTGVTKGERTPFRFMLSGDSRGGYVGISKNIERLRDMKADFWFFNGDMNEMGTSDDWESWFSAMSPLLVGTVLMPVQGNHEIVADQYYEQFALPVEPGLDAKLAEHAWTFDYGNIHFIGLNTINELEMLAQTDWLEQDLAAASTDPDIDWIIAMFHHPAYSACTNHGSTARVQKMWVPLFEKYGVDLGFSGHDHDYERTHPIRGDQIAPDGEGVVYVVAGGFYSDGYSNGTDWWTVTSEHGDKGDYVVVDADGKTLRLKTWSGDGSEVLDEFTLTKP